MRITCVIHSLCGGGAERLMAGLVNRLADQHHVALITLDDASNDRYEIQPGVHRISLRLMSHSSNVWQALRNNRRRMQRLRLAIGATDPDVVLSFCDKTNILTLAAMLGRSTPVVVSEHTDPRQQVIGPVWSWLRRRLYPRAADVIALTTGAAQHLAQWTARYPAIIPPAVGALRPIGGSAASTPAASSPAAADLPAPPSKPQERYRLLCVGRLSPEKGFDRAIAAFASVAAEFPDWQLEIAGEGPQRSALADQIDRLGMAPRVELKGWVGGIAGFLASGDAFLMTSLYEGFPVSLLEAMAAGLPCLSVDCQSGPAEVIDSGINGLLVPQDDPRALAEALRRLMSEPDVRQRLGAAAAAIQARFGWDAFVAAHLRVLAPHERRRGGQNRLPSGRPDATL